MAASRYVEKQAALDRGLLRERCKSSSLEHCWAAGVLNLRANGNNDQAPGGLRLGAWNRIMTLIATPGHFGTDRRELNPRMGRPARERPRRRRVDRQLRRGAFGPGADY